MSKPKDKPNKNRSAHDKYELPDEVDFGKTRFVGFGLEALERYATSKKTTIHLDPDVARVFGTSDSVNMLLRAVIQSLAPAKRKKKSA